MSLQAAIKKRFSGFSLDVSLNTDGGVMGILGASGSGKSMTLKCIAGIETPETWFRTQRKTHSWFRTVMSTISS